MDNPRKFGGGRNLGRRVLGFRGLPSPIGSFILVSPSTTLLIRHLNIQLERDGEASSPRLRLRPGPSDSASTREGTRRSVGQFDERSTMTSSASASGMRNLAKQPPEPLAREHCSALPPSETEETPLARQARQLREPTNNSCRSHATSWADPSLALTRRRQPDQSISACLEPGSHDLLTALGCVDTDRASLLGRRRRSSTVGVGTRLGTRVSYSHLSGTTLRRVPGKRPKPGPRPARAGSGLRPC